MKFQRRRPILNTTSRVHPQEDLRIIEFMQRNGYIDYEEATFMRRTLEEMMP